MRKAHIFLTVLLCLSQLTAQAQAQVHPDLKKLLARDGGGTSGGGNLQGISAKTVFETVRASILAIGADLYPAQALEELSLHGEKIKIIVTTDELQTVEGSHTQTNDAFSAKWEGSSYMYLKSANWHGTQDPLKLEELVHHELMVLLGLEKSGDYTYTQKFSAIRSEYWKLIQTQNNFCSIHLFEKTAGPKPGKLLGSSVAMKTFIGAKADLGVLFKTGKKDLVIWRGIIDSFGYFRMQIDQVTSVPRSELPDLSAVKSLEPMRVYSTPYAGATLESRALTSGEKFWIMVNCNRF